MPKEQEIADGVLATQAPVSATFADICAYLNELLAIDPKAITALVEHREFCDAAMEAHPNAIVAAWSPELPATHLAAPCVCLGLLGVLGGLLIRWKGRDEWRLQAVYDDATGVIIRFELVKWLEPV